MAQQPSKPGWPYGSEINYYQQPLYNIPYSAPVKCMESCCQSIRVPAPRRPYQHLPYFQQESVNHYQDSRPKQPVPNFIPLNHYWPTNCQPQYQHPPIIHRPIPQSKCDYKDFYKINKHRFQPYPNNPVNIEPLEKRQAFPYPPEKPQKKTGDLDVRQFLATWQEKDDDSTETAEVSDMQHEVRPSVPPKEVFQPLDCTKRNESYKRMGKYFRDPNYLAHHGAPDKQPFHNKGFVQHPKYEFSFPNNYNMTQDNNGYPIQYKNYPDPNMPKNIGPDGAPMMMNHPNKLYDNCNMGNINYNENYAKDCHKSWGSLPCERRIDKIFNPIGYSMAPHSVNIHQNKNFDKNCSGIPPSYSIDANDPYISYKPGSDRNQYNLTTCLENDELFDDINNKKDTTLRDVEQVSCYDKNICLDSVGQLAPGPEIMASITQNPIPIEHIQQDHVMSPWEHVTAPPASKSDVTDLINLTPCPSQRYSTENQLEKTTDKCILLQFNEASSLKDISKADSSITPISDNCHYASPHRVIVPPQEENSFSDCPLFSSISSSNELSMLNECSVINAPKNITDVESMNEAATLNNQVSDCSLNEAQRNPQTSDIQLVTSSDNSIPTVSGPSSVIEHLISSPTTDPSEKLCPTSSDLCSLNVGFLHDKPEPIKNVSDQISSSLEPQESSDTIVGPSVDDKDKLLPVDDIGESSGPDTSSYEVDNSDAGCLPIPSPTHISSMGELKTSSPNENVITVPCLDSENCSVTSEIRKSLDKECVTTVPQVQNALESIAIIYDENPSSASSEEISESVNFSENLETDLKSPAESIISSTAEEWPIEKESVGEDMCSKTEVEDVAKTVLKLGSSECLATSPMPDNFTSSSSNPAQDPIAREVVDLKIETVNSITQNACVSFNNLQVCTEKQTGFITPTDQLLLHVQDQHSSLTTKSQKKVKWLKPNNRFSKIIAVLRNFRTYLDLKHSSRNKVRNKSKKKKAVVDLRNVQPNNLLSPCVGNVLNINNNREGTPFCIKKDLQYSDEENNGLEINTKDHGDKMMKLLPDTKFASVETSDAAVTPVEDIKLDRDIIEGSPSNNLLAEDNTCEDEEVKERVFILLEDVVPEESVNVIVDENSNLDYDVDSSRGIPTMLVDQEIMKDSECDGNTAFQPNDPECELINDATLPDVDNWPYLEEEVQTVPDNINIKCSLSWEKIFNSKLKKRKDSKKAVASLELGPAKVEVRLSPEVCKGQWKIMEGNKDVNSSIVKVKRIILKRKSVEEAVPKVVIKKTNHEYKSYIKETKFQPRVMLERISQLDFLAQQQKSVPIPKFLCEDCSTAFNAQRGLLAHKCKSREVHHCVLCQESFLNQASLLQHQESQAHRHLELIQRNAIHSVYKLLTGDDCPFFSPLSSEDQEHIAWHPDFPGYNHYYHHVPL